MSTTPQPQKPMNILKLDLRQIHGDTVRALSENRRRHDDLRVEILQMLAEALRMVRSQFDVSAVSMADMAGCHYDQVLDVERGLYIPCQPLMEAYIALHEARKFLPMPKRPATDERIHFMNILPDMRWRPSSKGPRFKVFSACGQTGIFGGLERVDCELCLETHIVKAALEHLKS